MLRILLALLLMTAPLLAADAPASKPTTGPTTKPLPFIKDIEAYEAADAKQMPASGGVVFLGSSSIRKWTTLAKDFPDVQVLNRGFGGSQIPHSIQYFPRIVLPYKPKAVVFYAGDNDLNAGRSPEMVAADFKTLVEGIHAKLPETKILFIAIKPSPSRAKLMDKARAANKLIEEYTKTDKRLGYIDVFTPMLDSEGKAREELFVADRLHLNAKGYELWTKIVTPYLADYKTTSGK